MYHYTDGGLRNVWLANGYTKHDTPFGDGVAIHDVEGLTRAICTTLTKKAGVLTGAELRYLRSAGMLLSQPLLGKLMGVDGQSLARWEKTGRVPRWADKLARLLYVAHAEGNVPIRRAVERLTTVERLVKQRIVVEETRGLWTPRLDEDVATAVSAAADDPIDAPLRGADIAAGKLVQRTRGKAGAAPAFKIRPVAPA